MANYAKTAQQVVDRPEVAAKPIADELTPPLYIVCY